MRFEEYVKHDATALADCIARGEVRATELVDTALARLSAIDPVLNTVVTRMDDHARQRAAKPAPGAFSGVPFLLKDLFQDYAGVRSTYGCKALRAADFRPERHAEIVARFLATGVNVLGKTNTPELGAKGVTETAANGITRNPWDSTRTPGGSSGGSAAAVAAGVVPMAGANDGGGSIRIPAACCGLFGLKPGRARVPAGPHFTDQAHGIATDHVISRSVRDSAAMLDAVAGYEPGAIAHITPPIRPYRESAEIDPAPMTIGVMAESPLGLPLAPEAHAALEITTKQLTDAGHHVERIAPRIDGRQLTQDFLMTWYVRIAVALDEIRARTHGHWRDFELDTRAMAHVGRAFSATEYAAMHERWRGYRQALADFHTRCDLLLTPTLAGPPCPVGSFDTPAILRALLPVMLRLPTGRALIASGMLDRVAETNLAWVPFTQLANLTGTPAVSVPLYWTPEGLPLGSQFVGPPGGETRLFELAGQLERMAPWFDRRPVVPGVDDIN
ncbi:amidase [Salinisphaera sp. Q1T1-3]|uniref:amidase n=1 Tax=Salinisphaera sp. Q1T1-3 TaxID=2321229 RepID=UPI000E767D63|nr:amidase [Salinisphaera sp. Q1T1-3]RJS93780.1 amidase [Salinisphaera sp. Q1T1-3]